MGGALYFVKFGNRPRDPIWPVDIFLPQLNEAQTVLGCLLADATDGFPIPFYPQCLQRAHENAALVDFDFDILQDEIFDGIRLILKDKAHELDIFRLRDQDQRPGGIENWKGMSLDLFPKEQVVGVFKGFREGGLEFHADLVLPYRSDFQNTPMHGQFVLVQLETPQEAVLGRITSLSSEGKLSSGAGEEFNIRAVREGRPIPEGLREDYLKYRIDIRVLGVLRNGDDGGLTFVPSHRRLPHVGSQVAFPSVKILQELAGHNLKKGDEKPDSELPACVIGHYALGEYVFAGDSKHLVKQDWMQVKSPEVLVRFRIEDLVSRRSFIFARAGFGKSNLNKLLFSQLYETTPTVVKATARGCQWAPSFSTRTASISGRMTRGDRACAMSRTCGTRWWYSRRGKRRALSTNRLLPGGSSWTSGG